MAFIESNPVRSGLVDQPSAHRYSSFARNALGYQDFVITPHRLYQALGATESDRQLAYRKIVQSDLTECQLRQTKEALKRQLVLGSDQFKDEIQSITNQRTRPGHPGRPREKHEASGYSS